MSLKAEIKAQLVALGYTGAIFYGSIPNAANDEVILLRDEGPHDDDPTGIRVYPRMSIFIRGKSRPEVEALARTFYHFFHVRGPLFLASGYRLSRSLTSGLPRDLGTDASDLHRWSLDLLLTLPSNTNL